MNDEILKLRKFQILEFGAFWTSENYENKCQKMPPPHPYSAAPLRGFLAKPFSDWMFAVAESIIHARASHVTSACMQYYQRTYTTNILTSCSTSHLHPVHHFITTYCFTTAPSFFTNNQNESLPRPRLPSLQSISSPQLHSPERTRKSLLCR